MSNIKAALVFAAACLCSGSASAIAIICDDCSTGGGGGAATTFPLVTVTGAHFQIMPSAPGVPTTISFGGAHPTPTTPTAPELTEAQQRQKAQCLADCATQDLVISNNCTIGASQLELKLSWIPYGTTVSGAVIATWITKNIGGTVIGAAGGYALGAEYITRTVNEWKATCAGYRAFTNNLCITQTCRALLPWWMMLMILPRRRDEAVNES